MLQKYTQFVRFNNLISLRLVTEKPRSEYPSLVPDSAKFYLPQLDGLRFFAFFFVFLSHAPPGTKFFTEGTALYWITNKFTQFGGWFGVDLFLCLSSFLLTALLIIEHKRTGSISIKQFLIRRALRIWPLYYLIILLSFSIFPHLHFASALLKPADLRVFTQQHLLPFSMFLGNFSYAYFVNSLTVTIAPLWTVSLEEQFYLFWPILLFILLPKNKKWFFSVLTFMILLSVAVRSYIIINQIPYPAIWVFTLGRLDAFALGALLGYLYVTPNIKPKPILALCAAMVLYKIVISSTPIGAPNTIWQMLLVDLAGCALIYAAIYSKRLGLLLATPPLPWLGKISFGLYIFHDMITQLTYAHIAPKILKHVAWAATSPAMWCSICLIAFTITLGCATISYYGMEKRFLLLKNRFTVVASRPA